ncbi:hypothetical protein GE061_012487 [Apolygus lucorum]|uniref:NADP-dependent oxidoreductase domain-containing protein n=1 Tax=Apolygus lucorum TaxID=248454 RepID=A0A8S9XSH4_APOLU|nr:hypothetical protein GE061_012487 [Apolygus lucorum]
MKFSQLYHVRTIRASWSLFSYCENRPFSGCCHYGNNPTITLNSGCEIPIFGLGTWKSKPQEVLRAVKYAIHVGYRHFDCAHVYQNQKEVGLAIKQKIEEGEVCRKNIFITSKLWNTFHGDYNRVKEGLEKTLTDLCLSYLDLYLMHWPMGFASSDILFPMSAGGGIAFNTNCHFTHVWKEMEKLQKEGLTRMIGVSNFNKGQIEKLLAVAEIVPAVNQVECHPYLNQVELSNFCRENFINLTAYSPLGARDFVQKDTPGPLDDATVISIAKNHCRSPAQVLIRYQIQRGHIVIPKSVSNDRIFQNINVFDFNLSDDDMAAIMGLEKGIHGRILRGKDYRNHPEYPFKELLGPASKDIPPSH